MKLLALSLLASASLVPALALAGADGEKCPGQRVIAIGDTHGDYATFEKLLRLPEVGMINDKLEWSGGQNCLVITGDMFDRGVDGFRIVDLLMRLENEAPKSGGRVFVSLGNHEILNLTGDWKDVSSDEYAKVAERDGRPAHDRAAREFAQFMMSEKPGVRSDFYQNYVESTAANGTEFRDFSRDLTFFLLRSPDDWEGAKAKFASAIKSLSAGILTDVFPVGHFARAGMLAPESPQGRWLLSRPIINRVNGVLFMHGGLSARWARTPWDQLNREAAEGLRQYFDARQKLIQKGLFHPALNHRQLTQLAQAELGAKPSSELKSIYEAILDASRSTAFASDGPLWYRGLAVGSGDDIEREAKEVLKLQKAERIVVGHSITNSGYIESPVEGDLVLLIDTGMSSYYRQRGNRASKPSALELGEPATPLKTFSTEYGKGEQGRAPKATWVRRQIIQAPVPGVQPFPQPSNSPPARPEYKPNKSYTNINPPAAVKITDYVRDKP